jgi:hypothetical protein
MELVDGMYKLCYKFIIYNIDDFILCIDYLLVKI